MNLRCLFGMHDWTVWRRPPSKLNVAAAMEAGIVRPQYQQRRCKRCGKKERRAIPFVFTVPSGVSQVNMTLHGGGGGGSGGNAIGGGDAGGKR